MKKSSLLLLFLACSINADVLVSPTYIVRSAGRNKITQLVGGFWNGVERDPENGDYQNKQMVVKKVVKKNKESDADDQEEELTLVPFKTLADSSGKQEDRMPENSKRPKTSREQQIPP